ncbi:MAG: S8 family peptidase, partial [Bacteroidota bacterium]|nr:S8 family peptidase [Bacteroidota bacterium]
YTQPMFYDTALTATRIRAAWDQYRNSGNAPSGFDYGSEFTSPAEFLSIGSDTVNIYSHHTHGTHVAGIAGGSGAGSIYRGMAFSSGFLFCTFLVDAAAVLDAFSWMQQIAEQDQKRLVINMSWGLHYIGTLDGNSLISEAIELMTDEGVVFVSSGGNNGDVDFHIKKEFQADTIRSRIEFYSYSANPNMWGQSISMWGEPGEAFSSGFSLTNNSNTILQESPWYYTATQPAYLDSFLVQGTDTVFFNLTADAAHPLNNRPHFRLRIKNTSSSLKIALKATAADGIVHFWNVTELTNGVGNWGMDFTASVAGWIAGDRNYGIGEPACTESLIAVAAYSSEYFSSTGAPLGGAIANFSSFGPTLDERVKPDMAAPGVNVASSISAFTDADFNAISSIDFEGNTYPFARFSGTSMSAPAVSGIIALMLEADPSLSPGEVRAILMQTARTDQHTGIIPSEGSLRWGMGKVNAYRAVLEALGVVSVPEIHNSGLVIWPNPASTEVHVLLPTLNFDRIEVIDITGRVIRSITSTVADRITISTMDWPAGAYVLKISAINGTLIGKIMKE